MKDARTAVDIVTPEGVPLHWNIARIGDRAAAFLIDCVIILAALLVVGILAALSGAASLGSWMGVLLQLAVFLLANFYFAIFEIRWRGQTPGKRSVGIRVVDRQGGPLRADAVFGRNFLRQLEVFVPLGLIGDPDALWPGAPAWGRALCFAWLLVFALMPLWNRHRLRIGDLVAGTMVVETPKAVLLEDMGKSKAQDIAFTPAQLGVYGVYELQVLEGLLRDYDVGKAPLDALEKVASTIQRKIRWEGGRVPVDKFLQAFYAAQRERLERALLFGKRKADKFAR